MCSSDLPAGEIAYQEFLQSLGDDDDDDDEEDDDDEKQDNSVIAA